MNQEINNENRELNPVDTNKKGGGILPIVLFIIITIGILVAVKFMM